MSSTQEQNDINNQSDHPPAIPAGYSLINGPNNQSILVPTFMVPATQMGMEVEQKRRELNADAAAPGPRPSTNTPWVGIAHGDVHIPADSCLSDREALNLHAEVRALQTQLGLSYKDAAHRLYMAEVQKMETETQAKLAFTKIRDGIDKTIVNDIYPPMTKIDDGDFDGPSIG
ncbi:hypothetical protein BYT27DRAFT_7089203 [Phlegmacium glaucopus]|nr:hypothetical protein BYT27DRAFT_7089203 [Phlegmacium glaucopus]